MKPVPFFAIALLLVHIPAYAQSKRAKRVGPTEHDAGGTCDTSAWRLVFSDEFEGGSLDRSKWTTWFPYSADGSDQCAGCRTMGTSNTIFRDDLVSAGPREWLASFTASRSPGQADGRNPRPGTG